MIYPGDDRLQLRDEFDWGSERGLFHDHAEADRLGGAAWTGSWRKNTDELRKKDFAILAAHIEEGMQVLDLGCANGAQMTLCGLLGAEVHGQDLDDGRVKIANEKLERLGLVGEAKVGDTTALQFDDNQFDLVLSSDFHEHLDADQQHATLREVLRVLRPAGRLVLKTPNLTYLRVSLNAKRLMSIARRQSPRGLVIPHTPGTDDPEHIGLLGRGTLEKQLIASGFDTIQFLHAPMRKLGTRPWLSILSTEVPVVRDVLGEALYCVAYKPIATSYFPT